ncbi:DUF982 domain-containing protein [Mesorhizobium sp. LNHC229A00]|uniref:DUF982 domain-containing protein n=1 Tax=Mesorhizobium sp. LNHC229A00 TaxID=1287240 RepID=UPI0003CEA474|nr:DUF982 domain-containing protein [Mesorhizobium sp. LNHC229A00]ESY90782.1 hypothetical protein X741_25970 [Mesorhizobium sp. LNHC229A00]
MQTAWFSRSVVSVGVAGAIRNLSNTHQAIGLLATHWRDAESRKQRSALRACRATSGDLPPETAREAYLEATREAHIAARQGMGDSVRTGRSP